MGILSRSGIASYVNFNLRLQILLLGVTGVSVIGAIYLASLQIEARSQRTADEFGTLALLTAKVSEGLLQGRELATQFLQKPDDKKITAHNEIVTSAASHLDEIERLAGALQPHQPDLLVGIESRGFLIAAPLAFELERGFAMVRKKGKLPGPTVRYTYDLEYGTDTIEIQEDAVVPGQRVVVLDDLVATGGTMQAAIDLVRRRGGDVVAAACIIELNFLRGRDRIDVPFTSMVGYDT